jgi:hypothetical protein
MTRAVRTRTGIRTKEPIKILSLAQARRRVHTMWPKLGFKAKIATRLWPGTSVFRIVLISSRFDRLRSWQERASLADEFVHAIYRGVDGKWMWSTVECLTPAEAMAIQKDNAKTYRQRHAERRRRTLKRRR